MITITEKLYQWDTGRRVNVSPCDKVQFAPQGSSVAVSITPEGDGAPIPDEVLQSGKPITVFLVDILEDNKEVTKEVRVFPVINRPRPKDYLPTAAEEAIGELKKITDEAKAAADMAIAAANVLFVTADTVEETVNSSAAEIHEHVRNGGDVYFVEDGEYYALVASLPTKATFLCYSDRGNTGWGNTIDFVFVESIGYWKEMINLSDFTDTQEVIELIKKNSLSRQDVIALLASGDIGNIDMGGSGIINASDIYTDGINIEDVGGTRGAAINAGNYDSSYAVLEFEGIIGDEQTILRHIAPGKQDDDAVTVGQLKDSFSGLEAALDSIIQAQTQLIGGDVNA